MRFLRRLSKLRLSWCSRWTGDSIKTIYLNRNDLEYPDSGTTVQVLVFGLTTSDSWCGIRGMFGIGGRPDCSGGHKAIHVHHFNLIGMVACGCAVRTPRWFWGPWRNLSTKLQYMVDTRGRHRPSVRYTARKVRAESAGKI